jgi:hypothetical protein
MPAHDTRPSVTKDFTAQLEQARSKSLDIGVRECALYLGVRPYSKPQLAHINCDRFASGFLMSQPDIVGAFTPDQFLVAVANYLGEPCPIFRNLKGLFIAHLSQHRTVDVYGDEVAAMPTLPGDHRRQLHNEVTRVICNMTRSAGVLTAKEPQNIFETGIPVEIYALWQAAGGNNNIVPDVLLSGCPSLQPTPSGGIGFGMNRDAILDVKTIANCKTGYGHRWLGSRRKYPDSEPAVEVKSRRTRAEYLHKVEKLDREHAGVQAPAQGEGQDAGVQAPAQGEGQGPGPFVGKLSSFETNNVIPVACGNFGEVNKTAARLLCVLAKQAARNADNSELLPSTACDKQRYSFLISEWRRALSVTITRGFATLKLCRIPFIRSTVASAVEAAKLQRNPAPSRFRDCPSWYRVNPRDIAAYRHYETFRFGLRSARRPAF